jgi:thiol-disulfide isomerase/thioredoxin
MAAFSDYCSGVSPRDWSGKHAAAAGLCAASLALAGTGVAAAQKPAIAGRDALTGKRVSLAQFRGKPVFVNVWGSWCEGCNAEAPVLSRFAHSHARQVTFLGIDTIDSKPGALRFYKRFDLEYPSIWDPRGLIAGAWSRGAPTTLVFDRRHRLVQRIEGSATLKQLNAALRRVTRT